MLVATIVQWSCQMADPRFYAIMFLIENRDDDRKMDLRLYPMFAISSVVSSVFNYSLNWIVIATIQDLSMTVCLLTESLQADEYLRKRKLVLLLSSFAAFLYALGYIVIPSVFSERRSEYISYIEIMVVVAYSIQGVIYSLTVFVCLLPAMKKLGPTMHSEKRDILSQFIVFMVAILLKSAIFAVFWAKNRDECDHFIILSIYFLSFIVSNLTPAFYMLWSHHKTFKAVTESPDFNNANNDR